MEAGELIQMVKDKNMEKVLSLFQGSISIKEAFRKENAQDMER